MAGDRIGVLIIDDHRLVADALRAAIERQDDLEVIGVVFSAEAATALADRAPDVALVDYGLDTIDGLEVTRQLKERYPSTRVVLITGGSDPTLAARAADAGCDGFLFKTDRISSMIDVVRAVSRGHRVFDPKTLHAARAALQEKAAAASPVPHPLTKREFEVLELLAEGASTAAIAERLYLSPHTVRSHVRHILEKLGAHSKLEAVSIAIRNRWLSTGDDLKA
ncbi:MAG: response regulator transcription factor [Acidimicrobiales bacterium]|nr:response regulator transcription factor [Acidimicrobiales bacterium]